MEIMVRSTERIVDVNGVPARVWEGQTDTGIPVVCLIPRIAAPAGENQAHFREELKECAPPSSMAVEAFPLKMVI